ncbi:MAG TPA: DUF3826 domain-containing protein [Candidatus Paceibacterota bacterium]|nr:DUF3826 domain-containing protein [Candidatus Paceibacterota bacterium]
MTKLLRHEWNRSARALVEGASGRPNARITMRKAAECVCWLTMGLMTAAAGQAAAPGTTAEKEAAYRKTIEERAGRIVAALNLPDADTAARVRDTIARQYFSLRELHDIRDAQARAAAQAAGADKAAAKLAVQKAKEQIRPRLETLHATFLSELAKDLTRAQVDQVKDGMTYGVAPLTYNVYLKMHPTLTESEKKQIWDWLLEAREIAMDEGTSEEKHAVFNKYKGKINNYLSRAGYDARKGAENLKKQAQTQ